MDKCGRCGELLVYSDGHWLDKKGWVTCADAEDHDPDA